MLIDNDTAKLDKQEKKDGQARKKSIKQFINQPSRHEIVKGTEFSV